MTKKYDYTSKITNEFNGKKVFYSNKHRNFYNRCDSITTFENFSETDNTTENLEFCKQKLEKADISKSEKYFYIITQLQDKICDKEIDVYEAMYILIKLYDNNLSKFNKIIKCDNAENTKKKAIELYGFYDIKFIKHLLNFYRTYNSEKHTLNLKKTN